MKLIKQIPNTITCLNLFFGTLGIIAVFDNNLAFAAWLLALAAVCDFLDGMAARLLNAKSKIGLELDSLADVVSFGVLPGFIMMKLMGYSLNIPNPNQSLANFWLWIALLIPVFSALRLAKFNIDTRQTESFLGLPTPANALFIASLPLILKHTGYEWMKTMLTDYRVLAAITLILGALLVSELPLFSLKLKNFRWKENQQQFILLAIAAILLGIFGITAVPFIIITYILLSVIFYRKPAMK